jgi:BspA type Leucine rich repeat region (6 copies)
MPRRTRPASFISAIRARSTTRNGFTKWFHHEQKLGTNLKQECWTYERATMEIMKAKIPLSKTTRPNPMSGRLKTIRLVKLQPLLLLLALPAVVQAQTYYYTNSYGIWSYTPNNGPVTITGITNLPVNGVVVIPDTINSYPVTSIGDQAFFDLTNVTSVIIPEGVTSIGFQAFELCTGLVSIAIPGSVSQIGGSAFTYCAKLASVSIPNGVTSLADQTFEDCSSLTSVVIPDGVTNIGNNVFQQCYGLANVTIPDSVVNIGGYAFFYCTNLTAVTIPEGVATIGTGAFQFCSGLTSVTLPKSVTSIGEYAFVASGLTEIMVDGQNSFYSSVDGVLFDKSKTTLIQYPGGVAGSYTITNGVTSIGGAAFDQCFNLTGIVIPDGVTNIADDAFNDCASLTSLIIPGSVASIGQAAFFNCYGLAGIYFQGNAPNLYGSFNFYGDNATAYYLLGTQGWQPTFGGLKTELWNPRAQTGDASFGVRTNRFGFNITGTNNLVVVVEAATNLAHPVWIPVGTNTLTGGSSYFSDPFWTNYPQRFYQFVPP